MSEFQRYSGRKCVAIRERVSQATQQEERDALQAVHEQRIPTPQELLLDPCTPFWAADVIRVALQKDCVDAANVFDLLAKSFDARLKAL
jgi:hypothetical protein